MATVTNPTAQLLGQKLPPLTPSQQRSNKSALSEKEVTVNSAADFKSCADFLGDIPAFSHYAKEVLEDFVSHVPFRMHVAAGKKLCRQTRSDENLYVLLSGSAFARRRRWRAYQPRSRGLLRKNSRP